MTADRPRMRLDAGGRLAGVDLARGLAVLGMLAAHLLAIEPFDAARPSTWIDVANGRSSILFATLAGVSIALMTGGASRPAGERLRSTRSRLALRAGYLWVIGILLILTGVPVFVILPAYALLFLVSLPLLRWRTSWLWSFAAAGAVILPLVQPLLDDVVAPLGPDVEAMLGWHYPFTLWIVFVAAGLAAGRSDLRRLRTQAGLLTAGAALALAGYGAAAWWPRGGATPASADAWISRVWTAEAHSGGLLEVVGSGGFALAVVGASLLLCRTPATWAVLPVRAVGSMPLTAYVGQIVAWALVAWAVLGDTGDLGGFRALDPFGPFAVTTLILCTLWALLLGRGPLERLLAWATRPFGRLAHPDGAARLVR